MLMKAKVNRLVDAYFNRPEGDWGFDYTMECSVNYGKGWVFVGHSIPASFAEWELKGSHTQIWLERTTISIHEESRERYVLRPEVIHLIDFS